MNPKYFGDSYDLAKRFFCSVLAGLGYSVLIDPIFTGKWNGAEKDFLKLIGATPILPSPISSRQTALFIDPDTGVRGKAGKHHVSFDRIASESQNHSLVFAFDQAFSFQALHTSIMNSKLVAMRSRGCHGFYYNSHAKFLFISREPKNLTSLIGRFRELGLPKSRLFECGT